MMVRRFSVLIALIALVALALPAAAQAQSGQRCFAETGYCISGRIRTFWEQNGGLPVFGLPITPQQPETIGGAALQVQWFERNRLELHPENRTPYDVLLGRLGAEFTAGQGAPAPQEPQRGCRFFTETGFNVCGDVLRAWRASGIELDGRGGKTEAESLALWGLPLTGTFETTLADGKSYTVQWFERARFELHPENRPPYNVLLGLLGKDASPVASAPPNAPAPPAPPAPPAAPPATGCGAVTQIAPTSAEGRAILADFVATIGDDVPGARASVIDSLNGWALFSFESEITEGGFILMRPLPNGRHERAAAWGGIAENGLPQIRAYFKAQAPDVPAALVDCWKPRAIAP